MLKEFKAFALRGNVIELAVAFIMGTAFGKIVTSLVNDIIMPPIGLLLGKLDFSSLYLNLSGTAYPSLTEAKVAGGSSGGNVALAAGYWQEAGLPVLMEATYLPLVLR